MFFGWLFKTKLTSKLLGTVLNMKLKSKEDKEEKAVDGSQRQ